MTQLSRSDNEWGKDERSARCRVDNRPQGYGGNLSHFTAYLQPYKEGGKLWTLHIQKKILFRIHSTLQLAKNTLRPASYIGHEVFHWTTRPSRFAYDTCSLAVNLDSRISCIAKSDSDTAQSRKRMEGRMKALKRLQATKHVKIP